MTQFLSGVTVDPPVFVVGRYTAFRSPKDASFERKVTDFEVCSQLGKVAYQVRLSSRINSEIMITVIMIQAVVSLRDKFFWRIGPSENRIVTEPNWT